MFDPNRIIDLVGIVGFEDDPNYDIKDLVNSSSGLKFQNVSPYLTLTNLYDTFGDIPVSAFPAYAGGTTYSKGHYSTSGGVLYRYINDNPSSGNATGDTSYWMAYTPFAKFLRDKIEGYMVDIFNEWMVIKGIRQSIVGTIASGQTINYEGSQDDLSDIGAEYPALLFEVKYNKGVIFTVEKIRIHLDQNSTFDLKLFKKGKKGPIQTETIVYTGDGSTEDFDLDYKLGPGFYYFTADYGAATPINSLQYSDIKRERSVSFDTARVSQISIFEDDYSWIRDNHGMNLFYSINCDYTDLFIEQKRNFERAIQYGVGLHLLKWVAQNPDAQVTRHTTKINLKDVEFEMYGDTQGKFRSGLIYKYEQMLKEASISLMGLDKVCLPCKTRGVRIRSI